MTAPLEPAPPRRDRRSAPLETRGEPGARDTWATPPALFDAWHRVYRFTVDAAALPWNAKLPRYWTPDDDGLSQPWEKERVWCNPPYSRGSIEPWVEKAAARRADLAALLVPVRTGTDWWHTHGRHADRIHWLRGRVRFEPPPGVAARAASTSPEDSVILVWKRRGIPWP